MHLSSKQKFILPNKDFKKFSLDSNKDFKKFSLDSNKV